MNWRAFSFAIAAAAGTFSASAASVSYGPDTLPTTSTDWSQSISFPQFDPSLGTLTEIDFNINGALIGTAKAENVGNRTINPTLNFAATITLTDSLGTVLAQTRPLVANSPTLLPFDGTVDFGGTSGASFSGLNQSYSANTVATAPVDLALFQGKGLISLTLGSVGTSQVLNGEGIIITSFGTESDGHATITYEYTPVEVPEPEASTWAAIGCACAAGGLTYFRRRRQTVA